MANSKKMRLKYLPFVIIFILLGGTIMANRPRPISESLRSAPTHQEPKEKVKTRKRVVTIKDDTIYCRTFRDCMGWPMPIDTIKNKAAKKAGNVIRLSNRNKAGHFCRLEFLGLDFSPRGDFYTPGILEFYPDSMKHPTAASMEISRVDFLSNSSGDRVLEERYYDINNQLLMYTVRHTVKYNPLTVDELYFQASGLGMPLIKTQDSTVQIQRIVVYPDSNTNISRIHQGPWPVFHPDGAFMIKQTFNPADKSSCMQYLDYYMNPMIATNGVAGEIDYYGKDGLLDSAIFIDTDGKPLEARIDCENPEYGNTYKTIVSYNKLGMMESMSRFRLNGEPAEGRNGTHRLITKYDSVGRPVSLQAFDRCGAPSLFDDTNWASQEFKYDSCGNAIEYHLTGPKGEPIANGEGISSFYRTYNQSELLASLEYGPDNDGKEHLIGRMEVLPDSIVTYFDNGVRYVVCYDSLRRPVSARYISETGVLDQSQTPAYSSYSYPDSYGSSTCTFIREFDARGNLQALSAVDSSKCTNLVQSFDSTGMLKESRIEQASKDWKAVEELKSVNRYGVPCRRESPDKTSSLRMTYKQTLTGEMYDIRGIDEFGEDDYMVFYGIPAVHVFHNSPLYNSSIWLDEDKNPVDSSTIERLPKYMSIEVTDSSAYNLGVKDNDLILTYGPDYAVTHNMRLEEAYSGWTVAETTLADEDKEMTVFRIDSVSPEKCFIRTISLPKGRTKDLGFVSHLTYKTRKQEERIRRTTVGSNIFKAKTDRDSLVQIFTLNYKSADIVDTAGLGAQESGHGILLKAEFSKLPDWSWTIGDKEDEFFPMLSTAFHINQSYPNAGIQCRYTVFDGKHILQFTDSLKNENEIFVPNKGVLRPLQLAKLAKLDELTPSLKTETLPEEIKVSCAFYLWNLYPKTAVEIYESYSGELPTEALEHLIKYYSTDCKDKKKVKLYKKQLKTSRSFSEDIDIINFEDYY